MVDVASMQCTQTIPHLTGVKKDGRTFFRKNLSVISLCNAYWIKSTQQTSNPRLSIPSKQMLSEGRLFSTDDDLTKVGTGICAK